MDFDETEEDESEDEDEDINDSRPLFPDSSSSVEDEDTALAILAQLDREDKKDSFEAEEEYETEDSI